MNRRPAVAATISPPPPPKTRACPVCPWHDWVLPRGSRDQLPERRAHVYNCDADSKDRLVKKHTRRVTACVQHLKSFTHFPGSDKLPSLQGSDKSVEQILERLILGHLVFELCGQNLCAEQQLITVPDLCRPIFQKYVASCSFSLVEKKW